MSINSVSRNITSRIARELALPSEKQAVIEYGLINLLSQLLTIGLLFVVAYIFNIVTEVLILGLCSSALRRYSGGAHCSSPLRCSLLSIIVIPILVLTSKLILSFQPMIIIVLIIIVNVVSFTIYYLYAPQDSPAKPIKNVKRIKSLKLKSILLSFIIFVTCTSLLYLDYKFIAILMTLGGFNQSMTLTKVGKSYIALSDRVLKTVIP